jgi:hypothetical protein
MVHSTSSRGSAIIFLFIAIALFAALAYGFMQNTRGSVAMMTEEQAEGYAQEIIAYGNDIKMAVKRLRLRGIADTELDFRNAVFLDAGGAPLNASLAACTSTACQIFDMGGGGMVPLVINDTALATSSVVARRGHWAAHQFIVTNVGTGAPELLFSAHHIKRDVCVKINQLLGVPNSGTNPPVDDVSGIVWNGAFDSTAVLGDQNTNLQGRMAMCFERGVSPNNFFQYSVVLLSR